MSGSQRRRRRTGSTARRYQHTQLTEVSAQSQVSRETILAGLAVSIVSATLIALIWMMALNSAAETRTLQREDVQRGLLAQAATLSEKVKLELLIVDQSLAILQAFWNENSDTFKLTDWNKRVPALTAVADDVFIADDKRIIQQDILPQAVGQGIGGAYLPFSHGSLEQFGADGDRIREVRFTNPTLNSTIEARRYLMYVVRPLGTPPKLLIGASYRSGELTRHLADAALGQNGFVGLMDARQGTLQAVAGAAARRPRTNLNRTDMFDIMRKTETGTWTGPTAVDGVTRIHAWSKVPGRDTIVVVGTPVVSAMAPGETIASGTIWLAIMVTGLVVTVAILVMWSISTARANRRRQRAFDRARSDLAAAQTEVAGHRLRSATAASQLRALLDGVTEAAAVFNTEMRLAVWNDRFSLVAGLPQDAIQEGLPLDELLRQQCQAGLFGPQQDPEAEISRRAQLLIVPDEAETLTQTGPEGTHIPVLSRRTPDAGLVLILGGLTAWQPPPMRAAPSPPPPKAEPVPEHATTGSTVEW